jgi:hypothetical protein
MNNEDVLLGILSAIINITVMSLVIAFPIMLLWNLAIPDITGYTSINFKQSFDICLMVILMIKSTLMLK